MRKFFRKFLIYLLAIGMLSPAWLATGVLKADRAKADAPTISQYRNLVIINEVYVDGSLNEWVEIFNSTEQHIELTGWKIVDSENHATALTSPDGVGSLGFFVKKGNLNLNDGSDTVSIIDSDGLLVNSMSYNDDFGSKSYGRVGLDWVAFNRPTEGTPNYVANLSASQMNFANLNQGDIASSMVTLSPNTSYGNIFTIIGLTNPEGVNFSDIFSSIKMSTDGSSEYEMLSDSNEIWYGPANGFSIVYGANQITTIKAQIRPGVVLAGDFEFQVLLLDSNYFPVSNLITFNIGIKDTSAPVVKLNGVSGTTLRVGDKYTELGVTVTDNVDKDLVATIGGDVVDTTEAGDYIVTYDATDTAGNHAIQVTRTVHVVEKVASVISPDFTVTALSGKTFRVEWTSNGAYSYIINVNGNPDPNGRVPFSATGKYSRDITVSNYGTYEISLIAMNGNAASTNFQKHSIELKAPAVTVAATPAQAAAETTVVTAGPTSAQVAAPVENKVETPVDDTAGQIKGDETKDNENEKTNWTPWIVLFVLILLAGAATGGYFYWFNGEEDVKAATEAPKKTEVKKGDNAVKTIVRNKNDQKKQKRW